MAQTATMLVTDLVGSTQARVRLGEDRAEQLRRAHDALLAEQASAYGGNVIKGLGDGLLVAFAGAAEALTAAVAMQQALDAFGKREGDPMAMRIGVSAGDVTFEDDDCFGTPVIEAARLCAAAEPGQILVAELVRLLERGRSKVELLPGAPMDLKGLPEPVAVCEARWEPVRASTGLRTGTPYVGREHERELLAVCWQRAVAGSGGLVLIAGEPGIGKTRLVNEFCEHVARPSGGVLLTGGCHDGDVVAYAPFVEAISDWVRRTPVETASELLGREVAVVARMVPAIAEVVPDVGEPLSVPRDAETARLHDAVGQVLSRVAVTAPVVLVLDDLHWADDATIGLLRALSRVAQRTPVLVIGTYRETDVDRRHPFAQALALMQREVEPTRIALSGLDRSEVHGLLERIAEHAVPEELAAMLAAETEGNPFFLRETLLHLFDEGELRFEDGVWSLSGTIADLGIPAGIRDVIGRRLLRLPDATNRLLAAGALFEVAFSLPIAAEVAGIDESEALDAIDAALEAGIARAADTFDQYVFTHALFRHTLVEELNPSRQVRMHRAIAIELEKQLRGAPSPAEAAALARHYHRSAALPNAEVGVPYAVAVADDAARRYARREEHDALTIALELLPEGDDREAELRRRIAATAVHANVGAERVLREAQRAGDMIRSLDGDDAACDFVALLVHECLTLDDVRLVWDLAAIARRWLRSDRRDMTYAVLRGAELAEREFDDADHPGVPLDTPERRELRALLLELGYTDVLSAPFMGSHADAERCYDAVLAGGTLDDLVWPLWFLGRHRELIDQLRASTDAELARGVIPRVVFNCAILARIHGVMGDYDAAQACLDDGFALVPRVSETSNAVFQLFAAHLGRRVICGELVASTELAGLTSYSDSPDVRWAYVGIEFLRGWALANEGRADAAIELLRELLPILELAGSWAQNYPLFIASATNALWVLERTDGLDVIERNTRTKVVEPDVRYPETDGRWDLARLCALDGRIAEARGWFAEARRVLTEQGSATLLISVDFDEALMNARLGGPDEVAQARALLDRARAGCAHPAVAPWLARINELAATL